MAEPDVMDNELDPATSTPTDDAVSRAAAAVIGVSDASVTLPSGGQLGSIRIVFEPGYDRYEVASRIAGVLRQRFGLRIDPDAIAGLAETAPARAGATDGHRDLRPLIVAVQYDTDGLDATARVVLSLDGREVTGTAMAADVPSSRPRTVAAAGLEGIQLLLGHRVRLQIDDLQVQEHHEGDRVIATVSLVERRSVQRLVGIAIVHDRDLERAAVRATLDAVNRRVELLLRSVS